jgi:hypothetical protein
MRHFRDIEHMTEALAEEAEKEGCTIVHRDGRTYAVVSINCECGCDGVTEVDLSASAQSIWGKLG